MDTPPARLHRPSRRRFLKSTLSAAALACMSAIGIGAGTARAAGASPADLVETFHDQLLGVMKAAETLGFQGRYDRLASPISTAFHLRLMTQI